jgi:hypothetical protein
MKCSVKKTMVAVAAICCIAQFSFGASKPVVTSVFGLDFFDAKTAVGGDGNYRVIWDYNVAKEPAPSTYNGSGLWIINPNGGIVATGSPTIPASVGSVRAQEYAFISGTTTVALIARYERSNTLLFAQPDGNTTVVFAYNLGNSYPINGFGVWTYNSAGALVAAAKYGPYTGALIGGMYFDKSGSFIVKWETGSKASAGWVLNEFGSVVSATNFYGPFGSLGKIRISSSGQQIWPFNYMSSGGFKLSLWTFNPSGSSVVNTQTFGPF